MEEGEEPVDPEVCHSRLLKYKGPNGEDYGTFYQSLVHLFGSILEARGTAEDSIASKVLDVTAGRQCTDLCQYLLTALPPSESFLKKFFTDEGFNIQVISKLIHVNGGHFCTCLHGNHKTLLVSPTAFRPQKVLHP